MMKTHYFTSALGCALALGFSAVTAAQGDLAVSSPESRQMPPARAVSADLIARSHWQSIAQGDVTALMGDYSPDAIFHWQEGAFEGDHSGAEAIRAVWIKFARVRSPLTLAVRNVQEKAGSKGSRVVTAEVTFCNADWTYPLAYRLVFRGGKIVEETWQLAEPDTDPALMAV